MKETAEFIRHYSKLIWEVRQLAIAQGVIILAAPYLVIDKFPYEIIWTIPIAGILFTIILWTVHNNYLDDFEVHLKIVENSDDFGSLSLYSERHFRINKKRICKWWIRHRIFIMIVGFIIGSSLLLYCNYEKIHSKEKTAIENTAVCNE